MPSGSAPIVFALPNAGFFAIGAISSSDPEPVAPCEEGLGAVYERGGFRVAEEDEEVGTKASAECLCPKFLLDSAKIQANSSPDSSLSSVKFSSFSSS